MKRSTLAELGQEALTIMNRGTYRAPSGAEVDVREAQARAVRGAEDFAPTKGALRAPRVGRATRFEVTGESTLAAARRVRDARPLALNFASARRPGGGFLGGAQAQEESLARASSLWATIAPREMYRYHARTRDPLYTHWAIHSPDVPVFRDDEGTLLEAPWTASFLTCAAPNAGVALERDPTCGPTIARVLRERIARVLGIAAHLDYGTLVLGAWGCGVFRNDTRDVAHAFHEALTGPFAGAFEHVVFAILDRSPERRFRGPFEEWFPSAERSAG